MTRIYHGIDIVEVSKIQKIMKKNKTFLDEVFTDAERSYCMSHKNRLVHLAGRFAAKEACMKALGTGLASGGRDSLRQIEIVSHTSGRPELSLSGWIGRISKRKKVSNISVSISHSGEYAVASVVMLGDE